MTDAVPENDRRAPYIATAGQTVFDIDFPIDAADEIVVYQEGDLLDPTDYTVDIDAMTVTLDTGASLNDVVVIEGTTKSKIATEFPRGGGLNSAEVNKLARRFIWMIQEIIRNQGRVVSANPAESDAVSLIMPLLSANGGKILGVSDAGDAIVMRAFADFAAAFDLVETDPAANDFMIREGDYFVNKTVAQIRALLTVPDLPADLEALKTLYGLGDIVQSNIAQFMAAGTAPVIVHFTDKVLNGLTLSNGADATNDVNIASGSCVSDDGTTIMRLSSAVTKQLDAAWAVGTNQGGRDTGSISDATWHVWLINRPDTGVTDVLLSTSATAPTLPANYTKKKCIGSIVRASAAIRSFKQTGNRFTYDTPILTLDAQNPGTSAVTRTLDVPTGVVLLADISVGFHAGSTAGAAFVSSLDSVDSAVQNPLTASLTLPMDVSTTAGASSWDFTRKYVKTDTSAQVRSRVSTSGANDRIGIVTYGWIDPRI